MNELMKAIMKELKESPNQDVPKTAEDFKRLAKELGHSDEEIAKALEGFDGFPLDLGDLDNVAGGREQTAYWGTPGNRF